MNVWDREAEMSVLGGVLLENTALDIVGPILEPRDFFDPWHRRVYEEAQKMRALGKPVDEVTLADPLSSDGESHFLRLSELVERIPTAANVATYAKIVRSKSRARMLQALSREMHAAAEHDDPTLVAERSMMRLLDVCDSGREREISTGREAARAAMQHLEKLSDTKGEITGIRSGFTDLDYLVGGFDPGDLVILAARPAMGKSALVLNMLADVGINQQKTAWIFQLEMTTERMAMRMLSSLGRVSSSRLRRGLFQDSDWARLARASQQLAGSKLMFDSTPVTTIADIRSVLRQGKARGGAIDLVVVDHLHILETIGDHGDDVRKYAELSRGLKQLAKEFSCPVIALAQLNRDCEKRQDKRPTNADLRSSGAIEQDADVIMFLYRDEVYNDDTQDKGMAELIISKQRNGSEGVVRLQFDGDLQRFSNEKGI